MKLLEDIDVEKLHKQLTEKYGAMTPDDLAIIVDHTDQHGDNHNDNNFG